MGCVPGKEQDVIVLHEAKAPKEAETPSATPQVDATPKEAKKT